MYEWENQQNIALMEKNHISGKWNFNKNIQEPIYQAAETISTFKPDLLRDFNQKKLENHEESIWKFWDIGRQTDIGTLVVPKGQERRKSQKIRSVKW